MLRVFVLFIIACFLPTVAGAAMFSYKDEHGVIHFTNISADGRARVKETKQYKWHYGPVIVAPFDDVDLAPEETGFLNRRHQYVNPYILHKHIHQAAEEHQIDPLLIKAIIKTESNFNPMAVSPKGAQGLMQLMPSTARLLQVTDPFDVQQNIDGGTRYFKQLMDSYDGNIRLSLAAYNAGPGRVRRSGGIPNIPETKNYVTKVMKYYRAYRSGLNQLGRVSIRGLAIK